MTITVKSKTINQHHVDIRHPDNAPGYYVSLYQVHDLERGLIGRTLDSRYYKTYLGACRRYEKLVNDLSR